MDLALARQADGRYDLVLDAAGDLVRTAGPEPAMLRLLLEDEWIADNGERQGPCLADVRFIDGNTRSEVEQIVSTRLAPLIASGALQSAQLDTVQPNEAGDGLAVAILYRVPGQATQTLQVGVAR